MSRLEVEASLGRPVSVLQRGDRLVLSYPKGGRVDLVNDRVVDMVHVPVASRSQTMPTPSIPESKLAEPEEPLPVKEVEGTKKAQSKSSAVPVVPLPVEEEHAETTDDEKPQSQSSLGVIVLVVLIGGAIRIAIVMVVLKLAFKWADVHADWGQMFLPALGDTIVRGAFEFIGMAVLHVTSWFYVDEATAYFMLLIILMKTTHACTLGRAVGVAAAAKLMSIVVGGLVMVYVMHALS